MLFIYTIYRIKISGKTKLVPKIGVGNLKVGTAKQFLFLGEMRFKNLNDNCDSLLLDIKPITKQDTLTLQYIGSTEFQLIMIQFDRMSSL